MRKLRVLMLHNRYQVGGGEDISTRNEVQLLRDGGHDVDLVEYDNREIDTIGRIRTSLRSIWSIPAIRDVNTRLDRSRYDVLHVQNYFPLISPAVLIAASKKGVATVQALRNYRLLCGNAQLFRDGSGCDKCVGWYAPWAGVIHGCYRGSHLGSAVVAAMIAAHKALGTWTSYTSVFVAVSEHVRNEYIRGGFPSDRIITKPNVVARANGDKEIRHDQIAYVGRLSEEKGVDSLISAWQRARRREKLVIAGSGPAENALRAQAAKDDTIKFVGHVPIEAAYRIMAQSRATVIPSPWPEPFPRSGVESFSVGTPVLGAASGGIVELLKGGRGGAIFRSGDVEALSALIHRVFDDRKWLHKLESEASEIFIDRYSPKAILEKTEEIYDNALSCRPNR